MEDTKTRNGRKRPKGTRPRSAWPGSSPTPASTPRNGWRRLVTLMIKYATGNGQAEPEGDDAAHEDDHAEGDG